MKNLADRPFALIGVHIPYENEDAKSVREVMTEESLPWRSFVDRGPIAAKWKTSGTPTFYLIDAQGVIRHKWAGAPGEKMLHAAVKKLVDEAEAQKRSPR